VQESAARRTAVYTGVNEDTTGLAHQHGAYVQDVRYADFAGAKIGDAAIAEKDNFLRYRVANG